MAMHRIPGSDRIVYVSDHAGDTVVSLGDYPELDNSVKQESVVKIGTWADYTGSGVVQKSEVMMQGTQKDMDVFINSVGTVNIGEFDDRGQRVETHRSRDKSMVLEQC